MAEAKSCILFFQALCHQCAFSQFGYGSGDARNRNLGAPGSGGRICREIRLSINDRILELE